MKKQFFIAAALVALAACSKPENQIAAAPVAGNPYAGFDCVALEQERINVSTRLTEARTVQQKRAENDAASVFLIGVPLAGLDGSQDQQSAIATMRGYIEAIDKEATIKGCQSSLFGTPEPELLTGSARREAQ